MAALRTYTTSILAGAFSAMLMAGVAWAQMVPLADLRTMSSSAYLSGGALEENLDVRPAPFASWDQFVLAYAHTKEGFCEALAYQRSEFSPGHIFYAGSTWGEWQNLGGIYLTRSEAVLRVEIPNVVSYDLYAQVIPGDYDPPGFVEIRGAGGMKYFRLETGETSFSGRLAPGVYEFEGLSIIQPPSSCPQNTQGPTYNMVWTVTPCASLITLHPSNQTVSCGANATFCVTVSGPGPFTYQWRRNLVPLVDDAHVSGTTTPCLTIQNACDADTAYYDVVVSDGSITEPSRLAHLDITTGTTDASSPQIAPAIAFTLGAAAPSPLRTSTSWRYESPGPVLATIEIFDVTGRTIRRFPDRLLSGAGTLTWDGTTASGSRAVPGLYFLRVAGNDLAQVRRIAIVR